ncbi:MAG TPA: glycosyltransferase family 2 protein [Stenomitos sp.]
MLNTPVALILFNRPDTTERVFRAIAQAKPRKLLVVADGPRPDKPGEAERCAAARAVLERIDWDCELLTNFSDTNLGTKRRVSGGLDWVFDQVEEAIILEDDCLPDPSFFPYCQELLERYRHDTRIAMIHGINKQQGQKRTDYSYYFTRYMHIWGWASWRRAWQHYDVNLALWPEIRDGGLLKGHFDPHAEREHMEVFEQLYRGEIDTWDIQWAFACFIQGGLAIAPAVNLISNLGFGSDATRTLDPFSLDACRQTEALSLPLRHPPYLFRLAAADDFETAYGRSFEARLKRWQIKLRHSLARFGGERRTGARLQPEA